MDGAGDGGRGRVELEIAVASAADARAATGAGADRVELCVALELGGLTPARGLVETVVATGAETHVLLRARPGDFVYDADEIAAMAADAAEAVRAGARGVVLGALRRDGGVDAEAVRRIAEAARGIRADATLTAHRAIDQAADPIEALGVLARLGVARVLSAGGASAARDGIARLRELAAAGAALGVALTAGGGVAAADVPALTAAGARAVHLSAKRAIEPAAGAVRLGADGGIRRFVADPARVRAVRAALDGTALDGTGA